MSLLSPESGIVEILAMANEHDTGLDQSLQCALTRTEENKLLIENVMVKVKEIMELRGYSDSMTARLIGIDVTTFRRITRAPAGTNRPVIDKMGYFIVNEAKAKNEARVMLSHKLGLRLNDFVSVLKDFIKFKEAIEEVASKLSLGSTVHDRNILFYLEKLTTAKQSHE